MDLDAVFPFLIGSLVCHLFEGLEVSPPFFQRGDRPTSLTLPSSIVPMAVCSWMFYEQRYERKSYFLMTCLHRTKVTDLVTVKPKPSPFPALVLATLLFEVSLFGNRTFFHPWE